LTGQAFEFKFGDHRQEPPKRSATSCEVRFIHPGAQALLGAGGGQGRTVVGSGWLTPGPGSPAFR
jgi:hypothetical protein